ncbi:MAG: VanZ family protein [Pyrinomonadaceae bacterium]|nr:VanZ family protein [Pyrinomonadaceae bacterium]
MKKLLFNSSRLFKGMAVSYALILAFVIFLYNFQETQHIFFIFATVEHLDKAAHLLVMGFFSFVVNLALSGRNLRIARFQYLMGSMIVFAFATLEESSQLLVRGRDFEFSDMFFNTAGILLFGEIARMTIKIIAYFKMSWNRPNEIS